MQGGTGKDDCIGREGITGRIEQFQSPKNECPAYFQELAIVSVSVDAVIRQLEVPWGIASLCDSCGACIAFVGCYSSVSARWTR